jgi:hypothetical protein
VSEKAHHVGKIEHAQRAAAKRGQKTTLFGEKRPQFPLSAGGHPVMARKPEATR